MSNLNRLGSGLKLIRETVKTSKRKNTLWSRANHLEKISKQKNPHTKKSRPK